MPNFRPWRELLPVHPAAELFPQMPPDELQALGEDILHRGMQSPIVLYGYSYLVDGRNRLDAMQMVGVRFSKGKMGFLTAHWPESVDVPTGAQQTIPLPMYRLACDEDQCGANIYAQVVSLNLHRRHLTTAQKSELIAKLLEANPERSDRSIAKIAKGSHHTVAAVRAEGEASGQIAHIPPTDRVDAGGRKRARKTAAGRAEADQRVAETPDAKKSASAALHKAYNKSNEIKIAQGLNVRWDLDKPPSLGWAQAVVKALTPTDFQSFKEWFQEYLTEAVATDTEPPAQADAAE